ncbi:MAG TPA: DUF1206 domain-containing protein [Candidatus Baltobacterales bacterium]|nr:DUF1206 domain-containing protein [Candidatus Baltobacterales bacterium]
MSEIHAANTAVKRAATNPVLELLERLGYAARGALYVVMGVLAFRIASGTPGGQATDLTGSLVFLIGNPFGKLVLIAMIVGLLAYSLWGFVRAIYDPMHRGRDATGIMARLGFVSSAVSYGAIALFGLGVLSGSGGAAGDSTQKYATTLLSHPFGGVLTIVVGLVSFGIGVGQFVEAYKATFAADLKGAEMSESLRKIAIALGRFGMAARGVTFLIIGWFLVQAGFNHNAAQAHGFGGAFLFLLSQPFGQVLVGVVSIGFIALGLHSFACARWVRLMGSNG